MLSGGLIIESTAILAPSWSPDLPTPPPPLHRAADADRSLQPPAQASHALLWQINHTSPYFLLLLPPVLSSLLLSYHMVLCASYSSIHNTDATAFQNRHTELKSKQNCKQTNSHQECNLQSDLCIQSLMQVRDAGICVKSSRRMLSQHFSE